jgi:hypothetical protein
VAADRAKLGAEDDAAKLAPEPPGERPARLRGLVASLLLLFLHAENHPKDCHLSAIHGGVLLLRCREHRRLY